MRSRAATTPPGPAIKIKSAASATVPFAAATLLSVTQLTRDRAALLYPHHGLAEPSSELPPHRCGGSAMPSSSAGLPRGPFPASTS